MSQRRRCRPCSWRRTRARTRRVVQTPERRLVAAVLDPRREQDDGARRAGDVRMNVGRDRHAGGTGGVDAVDQHGGLVPVVAAGRLDVAVVEVAAGPGAPPRSPRRWPRRPGRSPSGRARRTGRSRAATTSHSAATSSVLGVGGRHVHEAGGEPAARPRRTPGRAPPASARSRRSPALAGVVSHHEPADRRVADERQRVRVAELARTAPRYSPKDRHVHRLRGDEPVEPGEEGRYDPRGRSSRTGAAEMPSCPKTWAVHPCSSFGPVAERRALRPRTTV